MLVGQYESWFTPVPVSLAVPLSLVGLPLNICVQIGLVLLIALSANNAIFIVRWPTNCAMRLWVLIPMTSL